jgi:hypothetical protein
MDLIVLPANAVPTVSNRDWSPVMHQRATVSDLDLTLGVPRMVAASALRDGRLVASIGRLLFGLIGALGLAVEPGCFGLRLFF